MLESKPKDLYGVLKYAMKVVALSEILIVLEILIPHHYLFRARFSSEAYI